MEKYLEGCLLCGFHNEGLPWRFFLSYAACANDSFYPWYFCIFNRKVIIYFNFKLKKIIYYKFMELFFLNLIAFKVKVLLNILILLVH